MRRRPYTVQIAARVLDEKGSPVPLVGGRVGVTVWAESPDLAVRAVEGALADMIAKSLGAAVAAGAVRAAAAIRSGEPQSAFEADCEALIKAGR